MGKASLLTYNNTFRQLTNTITLDSVIMYHDSKGKYERKVCKIIVGEMCMRSLPLFLLLNACIDSKETTEEIETTENTDSQTDSATEPISDRDADGVADSEDSCPDDPQQWTDNDEDGFCDEVDDACPDNPNEHIDSDGDGICDDSDPCPQDPLNVDTDGDGICDADDDCPEDPNNNTDSDGDGICDESDACPEDANGWADSNGDGQCDENDDNDGDGITNGEETVYGSDCGVSNPNDADTDNDGINDAEDPYPRDPWPEFILFQNDLGTIDLMLSNRDGTFHQPIVIGDPYGGTSNTAYRYIRFVISDWDNNGKMDFLAIADSDPSDNTNPYDVWWFWREKADELQQRRIGTSATIPFGSIGDFNNDELVDIVSVELERPNYISGGVLYHYQNVENIGTANCFMTEDPTNPDNCAFIKKEAVDISSWVNNQWVFRLSRDAIDANGDGNKDVSILRISSGGNTSVPITILFGNGDGTFGQPPSNPLITHNSGQCGNSPSNSLLLTDFNLDGLGDIITGLDDDGDAGSAWFYPGKVVSGAYGIDMQNCTEAFDINPTVESGSDNAGNTASARSFDFDFDGIPDIMVGFQYLEPWNPPSKTVLLFGNGDGTFTSPIDVRSFQTTNFASNFAVPQRLCVRFPL